MDVLMVKIKGIEVVIILEDVNGFVDRKVLLVKEVRMFGNLMDRGSWQ
jgi:hypothetical protein